MSPVQRPITFALAALGGQGGGVVADWLIAVARREAWLSQATSVPGVAQRTGATIYYLEFFPRASLPGDGREPVMALMPHPGDVDVVVASELLEAGRAVARGIVTPDRTAVIASSHRVYAIGEKLAMADGRADAEAIAATVRANSKRFISFDMQRVAEEHATLISAVLLGAIAGARVLPFELESFRAAIRDSGIAVEANLAAFEASARLAGSAPAADDDVPGETARAASIPPRYAQLVASRYQAAAAVVTAGIARLLDYQDAAYADDYLARLERVRALEPRDVCGPLTEAVARYLALWMSFEDTIRVADLKIRSQRARRVAAETRPSAGEVLHVTEFMKPRVEEICGTLPARLGRWLLASPRARGWLARFAGSRQIATTSLGGFLLLYVIASLRRWRRGSLRYADEHAQIGAWLALMEALAPRHYALAVEVAECQRLVKGYGDTHERGRRSFELVMERARQIADREDGADVLRTLCAAALSDEQGTALQAALRRAA
ncbi:MAG TPA: indolepyruvate oxidoreductase subunit beta family protein [Steroidobacteraceae bacterium]|nr:indolepyruvate oxidoreductase subunit beta family protein [Steroidobacteraceae bacterium]